MRRLTRVPIVLATALVVLFPTAAFANADRFYVAAVRVSSDSCKNVPVAIHITDAAGLSNPVLRGWVEMSVGGYITDTLDVENVVDSGGWVRTRWEWCPYWDELGNYKAVATELIVSGTDSSNHAVERTVSGATTYFPVRQHSYFRPLSLTRSGSTVTITGQAMYYSLYASALRPLGVGTSVALRRGTYGSSSTSYLKTVKVGEKGIVRVSFTSSSKYAYQLFYPGNSTIWYALSGVVQG